MRNKKQGYSPFHCRIRLQKLCERGHRPCSRDELTRASNAIESLAVTSLEIANSALTDSYVNVTSSQSLISKDVFLPSLANSITYQNITMANWIWLYVTKNVNHRGLRNDNDNKVLQNKQLQLSLTGPHLQLKPPTVTSQEINACTSTYLPCFCV